MNDRIFLPRLLGALALCCAATALAQSAPEVERAKYLWSKSPHGNMLERILPPSIEPRDLPEPQSQGARLTSRYCVQCHYLPNPHMHTPDRGNAPVVRLEWGMYGKGQR